MLAGQETAVREPPGDYYEKYCDERDRAVRAEREANKAEREVNRAEREALAAERRVDELRRQLADQQERILHSVMLELKSEHAPPELIARVHAAVVDYASTAGVCDKCGRAVIRPGDTGAELPQP